MLDQLLADRSPVARNAVAGFAVYLSTVGFSEQTCPLFFKILKANYREATAPLFGKRSPESFFVPLQPNRFMVVESFAILTMYNSSELIPETLSACIGVLAETYKHAASGIQIYSPTIPDLYHVARHLQSNNEHTVSMIVDLLQDIHSCQVPGFNDAGTMAGDIVMAWLDRSKGLSSILPRQLLEQ
jgi:hypothetical protein